jgi:hypothetical protein
MIDKLIEVGRGYGMEINVEITKTIRISKQPTPLQMKIDKKPVENVDKFKYRIWPAQSQMLRGVHRN